MRIGAVIQARMGSSRLPGKVLRPIAGQPLLSHVTGRLALLQTTMHVVVATSTEVRDDAIVAHCREASVVCFRGSETDVLGRYYSCAQEYDFDHIVRLTADNPFTDIEEMDRLVELHLRDVNDYTHSFGVLPVGVGVEIFTGEALALSHRKGRADHHREHVNEYIQENPRLFRIGVLDVPPHKQHPDLSVTVDTEQDYVQACEIADRAAGKWATTAEAIAYVRNSR